jgi:hypothetical protein
MKKVATHQMKTLLLAFGTLIFASTALADMNKYDGHWLRQTMDHEDKPYTNVIDFNASTGMIDFKYQHVAYNLTLCRLATDEAAELKTLVKNLVGKDLDDVFSCSDKQLAAAAINPQGELELYVITTNRTKFFPQFGYKKAN